MTGSSSIKHKFASAKTDGVDATLVQPSNWNDDHDVTSVEGTVVAASSVNLGTSTSIFQTITGSTAITGFVGNNLWRKLRLTGSPLLTYNATSLITPTGLNIQGAPGDTLEIVTDGSGNARIIHYTPCGGVLVSTFANQNSGTATPTALASVPLTPGKWRLSANVVLSGASANRYLNIIISATSGSFSGGTYGLDYVSSAANATAGPVIADATIPAIDITVAANTTYYLNVGTDTTANPTWGTLRAERII